MKPSMRMLPTGLRHRNLSTAHFSAVVRSCMLSSHTKMVRSVGVSCHIYDRNGHYTTEATLQCIFLEMYSAWLRTIFYSLSHWGKSPLYLYKFYFIFISFFDMKGISFPLNLTLIITLIIGSFHSCAN